MRVPAPYMAKAVANTGRRCGLLGLTLICAGCSLFAPRDMVGPVDEIMFAAQPDACGLAGLTGLQGQPLTTLADRVLLGQLRVIWPGQEVMSGLVPDRLNAQVSDDGRIVRLSCG